MTPGFKLIICDGGKDRAAEIAAARKVIGWIWIGDDTQLSIWLKTGNDVIVDLSAEKLRRWPQIRALLMSAENQLRVEWPSDVISKMFQWYGAFRPDAKQTWEAWAQVMPAMIRRLWR